MSSEAQMNRPPFFISLMKGEVIIIFKFKIDVAFPFISSGRGQNSFPMQLRLGSLLLFPPFKKCKKILFYEIFSDLIDQMKC